jgi:hypothetical protein
VVQLNTRFQAVDRAELTKCRNTFVRRGQVLSFGADLNGGITGCGLLLGGAGFHTGLPPTCLNGSFLATVTYSWAGPRGYLGNGWGASGRYWLGAETGGSTTKNGLQRPGYAGFGVVTPGGQLSSSNNRGIDLHLVVSRYQ